MSFRRSSPSVSAMSKARSGNKAVSCKLFKLVHVVESHPSVGGKNRVGSGSCCGSGSVDCKSGGKETQIHHPPAAVAVDNVHSPAVQVVIAAQRHVDTGFNAPAILFRRETFDKHARFQTRQEAVDCRHVGQFIGDKIQAGDWRRRPNLSARRSTGCNDAGFLRF